MNQQNRSDTAEGSVTEALEPSVQPVPTTCIQHVCMSLRSHILLWAHQCRDQLGNTALNICIHRLIFLEGREEPSN